MRHLPRWAEPESVHSSNLGFQVRPPKSKGQKVVLKVVLHIVWSTTQALKLCWDDKLSWQPQLHQSISKWMEERHCSYLDRLGVLFPLCTSRFEVELRDRTQTRFWQHLDGAWSSNSASIKTYQNLMWMWKHTSQVKVAIWIYMIYIWYGQEAH